MRSLRFLLITVTLLFCLHTVTAAPRYPFTRRQDDNEAVSASSIESAQPSITSHLRESSTVRSVSDHQSATKESASRSSAVVTSSVVTASPSATASSSATTNGTDSGSVSNDPLPLHPKITPALGLIGALFLISGTLYAVVGIKNKWIYVFGSAAYLAALAVTVLIVYLMSPPVSNAVQGAFFVAAFITGVMFGALALIFSDLTEGLGCLLGGYCLSMWFLSLKEGGLITSTGGRAAFIGCMSVAGYCLSFSHYTRTYGLIGSISFSGATIAMLGVDCFSRAGWKEFWLYLWNLNSDVFPLNTTTYPLTKGLKAELAGVVIVCIFGVVSQLRLWKLIKERRDKREELEQQSAESQQKQEAELGRKIEDKFQKERREWEATYGEKGLPGSSVESGLTTPQTPSLYEKEYSASTYGSKADLTRSTNKQAMVTVAPVQEEEIQQIDAVGLPVTHETIPSPSIDTSRSNSARPSSEVAIPLRISRSISTTSSLKPSSPPPPVVVPLPFRVLQEEDAKSHISEDNSSVYALPDTEEEVPIASNHDLSRRLSGKPTMKRNSTARSSVGGFQAEDVALTPQIEDDGASSVAATLDEEDTMSLPALSRPGSLGDVKLDAPETEEPREKDNIGNTTLTIPENDETRDDSAIALEGDASTPGTPTIEVQGAEALEDEPKAHAPVSSPSQNGPRQSLTVSTDPKHDDTRSKRDSAQGPRLRHDTLVKEGSEKSQVSSAKSDAPSSMSQDGKAASVTDDFSSALPARLSKVATSYRTNEWAKHLELADKPEVEDISEPNSPGTQLDHERPAPVSEGIAQPFAVAKRASKGISSDSNAHRKNAFMQINSNSARQSQGEIPVLSREASQMREKGVRTSGSQQASTVDVVNRRVSSGPTQLPSKTLLGKRESLMRNRVSSQNFNQQVSSTNEVPATTDEDMTLAQRKRVLKHQKPPSASQKWQKSSWAAGAQVEGFDSHQPKRTVGSSSDQKREELLAGWRGSIQQNGTPQQSAAAREEQQRVAMMNAKKRKEMEQQQQAILAQQRESTRLSMMRSTEMLDAHREAMRRMQASANKKA